MEYKNIKSDYHPKDTEFANSCEGWSLFKQHFLLLAQRGETEFKEGKWKNHKHCDFYETVKDQMFVPDFSSTLPLNAASLLFDILIVRAEYLFAKLALQAEFTINTEGTEALLVKIKHDLVTLAKKVEIGTHEPITSSINDKTPVWILQSFKSVGITAPTVNYTIINNEVYLVTRLQSINFWVFQHVKKIEITLPKIRFDGKFLIAIPKETQKLLGNKIQALVGEAQQ